MNGLQGWGRKSLSLLHTKWGKLNFLQQWLGSADGIYAQLHKLKWRLRCIDASLWYRFIFRWHLLRLACPHACSLLLIYKHIGFCKYRTSSRLFPLERVTIVLGLPGAGQRPYRGGQNHSLCCPEWQGGHCKQLLVPRWHISGVKPIILSQGAKVHWGYYEIFLRITRHN